MVEWIFFFVKKDRWMVTQSEKIDGQLDGWIDKQMAGWKKNRLMVGWTGKNRRMVGLI